MVSHTAPGIPTWLSRLTLNFLQRRLRSVPCSKCQTQVPLPRPVPDTLWETRIDCPGCGRATALMELFYHAGPASLEQRSMQRSVEVPVPVSLSITTSDGADERVWNVPAKGGFNFFYFFSALWLTISLSFTYLALRGPFEGAFALVFFNLIGFGTLYVALRLSLTRHRLRLTPEAFIHERIFLGRVKRRVIPPAQIEAVDLVVFYEKNYSPVYGIEVRGAGRKLRFGSSLPPEEKTWLWKELRVALALDMPPEEAARAVKASAPKPHARHYAGGEACVELPPAANSFVGLIVGALFVAIAGFIFYQNVGGFSQFPRGSPGVFQIIDMLFTVIGCVFPLVFMAVGGGLMWYVLRYRQTTYRILVHDRRLIIETSVRGRTTEEVWEADAVEDVRVTASTTRGSVHQSMLCLELPDRVRCLGGQSEAFLKAAAASLRVALGMDA